MTDATYMVEPPVLGFGPGGLQPYTGALLAISQVLRDARLGADRRAWSDRGSSDRESEVAQRLADPPARTMTGVEQQAWTAYVSTAAPDGSPPQDLSQRKAEGPHGQVTVTVAPMPLDPDAWGLHAVAHSRVDNDSGEPTEHVVETYVRCADEVIAKRLGDDLLGRGPAAVGRLDEFAHVAAERAAAAAAGLVESGQQRQLRIAEILRSRWSREPELVERMIQPTEAHRRQGHREWNPAFGALCYRIAQLEEHGYTVAEVIDGLLRPGDLLDPEIRNPSAFAEYLIEHQATSEGPIHLGNLRVGAWLRDDQAAQDPSSPNAGDPAGEHRGGQSRAGRPSGGADRRAGAGATASEAAPAAVRDHIDGLRRSYIETRNTTVEPALAAAVDPALLAAMRRRNTYGLLLEDLYTRHRAGIDLTEHLAGLPTARIENAHDPVAYLRKVLKTRAAHAAAAAPDLAGAADVAEEAARPIGVDRDGVAALLKRAAGPAFAAAVTSSESWPGLAERMQRWALAGFPVEAAVADLSHQRIGKAADPARFTGQLLNARFSQHRGEQRPSSAASRAAGYESGSAAAEASSESGRDGEHEPLASEQRSAPEMPLDRHDLDPYSAVDQIGLANLRGQGSVADDAALDAAVDGAIDGAATERRDEEQVAVTDGATTGAHTERGEMDTPRDGREQSATNGSARQPQPDSLEPSRRRDTGNGVAEDGMDAARAHTDHIDAGVLDEHSAAVAAATRADRAFTPPAAGTGPAPRRRPSPKPRQPTRPVEPQSPERTQSRHR